jgi:NAD(P)-dependent dehydrogenase (short-subunit alcohol dehydrogenase family)
MVDAVIVWYRRYFNKQCRNYKDNLLMRMSEEDFDKVIDVNLKSVFNMTSDSRTFLKQRSGSIINMSSVVGEGNAGQTNYAASKAGVIGFTKSVALELVLVTFVAMLRQDLLKPK